MAIIRTVKYYVSAISSVDVTLYWPEDYRHLGGSRKKNVAQAYNNLIIDFVDRDVIDLTATNRSVWNIFRAYYNPAYYVAGAVQSGLSIGDYIPHGIYEDQSSLTTIYDNLYIADTTAYANKGSKGTFLQWLEHKHLFGTEDLGNLPSFNANDHIGSCHHPCPYDTQASTERSMIMLGITSSGSLPAKVDHGIYYMDIIKVKNGYGYICTYESCPGKVGNQAYIYA